MPNGLSDIDETWTGGAALPDWFERALSVPRHEGFVDVNGVPVHYFRWGKRGKRPVLMTHGFLAHARCLAFIAPLFAADYDIVAYDLSGMGDSGSRNYADDEGRAGEMIAVAQGLDMFSTNERPIIVAHSFGARVGVNAVTLAPDLFGGLIACDMMLLRPDAQMALWERGHGPPGSGDASKPVSRYPDFATARRRYVTSPRQDARESFLMDYMAFHSLRKIGDEWTWKYSPSVFASLNSRDSWLAIAERFIDARCRKAIIYGRESPLFTADSRDYVREQGGEDIAIVEIPDARHHLMLDQPIAFAAAIAAILAVWTGSSVSGN
ncbi:alpha/beta hydrolase [Sphingobium sp. TB-6]|uniref:alpha/beta fold hydrolase n=1 Tax=Sphingobium sp. TB-6 TaxID=2728850 RepID=UPI001F10A111|nr:alpha/beta hydrolase [Sphingobium sp. TB-6]